MQYREPRRLSKTGTVLRHYAAAIESGCIGPPPSHLLSVEETVEAFRFIAMTLDREIAGPEDEREREAMAKVNPIGADDFLDRLFRRRARLSPPEGSDKGDGSGGGAGRALAPGMAPRPRRRRGPQ